MNIQNWLNEMQAVQVHELIQNERCVTQVHEMLIKYEVETIKVLFMHGILNEFLGEMYVL